MWMKRQDGTLWFVGNPDVQARCLKDGFVPSDPPAVVEQRAAAERERLKAELRAELAAEAQAAVPAKPLSKSA